MAQIKIEAPAKINLVLEVLGKRDDGYHEISTVFQSISLCDRLTLKETKKEISLQISKAPTTNDWRVWRKALRYIRPSDNIVYKAAVLFSKEAGIKKGVEINLEKNIPVGAGLGGGSSDAASVLLGLNKLWKTGFTKAELKKMAVQLGMDVPFFIDGGTAYATGRGETIQKISQNLSFWVLLIDPGFSVSTKWAYNNIYDDLLLTKNNYYVKIMLRAIRSKNVNEIAGNLYNTFEELTKKEYPGFLEKTKRKLAGAGAIGTLMTGSGPVVFGIVKGRRDAYRGFKLLGESVEEKVYLAKTIGGWR